MRTGALVLLVFFVMPASGRSERAPITIDITPGSCLAPCSVRLSVRIDPDHANRGVTIVAESDAFYRSSTRPLEGADAARTQELLLREIPAGEYDVHVLLDRGGRTPMVYERRFQVG